MQGFVRRDFGKHSEYGKRKRRFVLASENTKIRLRRSFCLSAKPICLPGDGGTGFRAGNVFSPCGPPQLRRGHYFASAGGRGLPRGRSFPAGFHHLRKHEGVRPSPLRVFHRRRQCGQYGGALFGGKDPPRPGRIHTGRCGRQAAGPQRHRLHAAGKAGLPGSSGHSGRVGGVASPLCPLRLLAG